MSTYGKWVNKVLNIEALARASLDHKSLAIKSTLLFILLFDFSNRGSQLEWLRPLGGWHPIVIEQSSCSSG